MAGSIQPFWFNRLGKPSQQTGVRSFFGFWFGGYGSVSVVEPPEPPTVQPRKLRGGRPSNNLREFYEELRDEEELVMLLPIF